MRFALINPPWSFEGSIYFGCREPHLPLEFGYSKALLERAGHDAEIIDGQMDRLSLTKIRERVADYRPDVTAVTTAPSYLFWRCAPPELRVPQAVVRAVRDVAGTLVAVGPHASTTPAATQAQARRGCGDRGRVRRSAGGVWRRSVAIAGGAARLRHGQAAGAPLEPCHARETRAPSPSLRCRAAGTGRGDGDDARLPVSLHVLREDNFRNSFRRRPLAVIAEELDGLIASGAQYVYFIDEIFLPFRDVLELIRDRRIRFGMQTRIDLWSEEMLDLAGEAGCVSIEAGVESITEEGRRLLDKKCKISTGEIGARLIHAKRRVPFVQANLLDSRDDDPAEVEAWREHLHEHGVWANQPVPLFPYPGSPDYTRRWGAPDDSAWERAHDFYLGNFGEFSDIQEQRPLPLVQLER